MQFFYDTSKNVFQIVLLIIRERSLQQRAATTTCRRRRPPQASLFSFALRKRSRVCFMASGAQLCRYYYSSPTYRRARESEQKKKKNSKGDSESIVCVYIYKAFSSRNV